MKSTIYEQELGQVAPRRKTLLSIGVFDGVHLGHRHLLIHLKDEAIRQDCLSGVITFKSHPRSVVSRERRVVWLDDLENRISLIRELGIDIVIALTFTPELSQLGAREFILLLQKYLKMQGLVVGPDFALGKNREGTVEQLRKLGQETGFTVDVVPPFALDGEMVSSSVIRTALAEGNLTKASKLLGRNFCITDTVVPGDERGRKLGFPTVNIELKPEQASPKDGVYATVARVNNEELPAVTNIGFRPTFEGKRRLIETYIIDFKGNFQQKQLKLEFVDRLRDERRFETAEELVSQIARDVEQARGILSDRTALKGG
jgi:riboflavin kinase/FMN adenylyltransferase